MMMPWWNPFAKDMRTIRVVVMANDANNYFLPIFICYDPLLGVGKVVTCQLMRRDLAIFLGLRVEFEDLAHMYVDTITANVLLSSIP